MELKKLTFLLATLAILFPTVANAGELDVRAGSMRVKISEDGSTYVNTGQTQNSVTRSPFSIFNPRHWSRYWSSSSSSCARGDSYSKQSMEMYGDGRRVVQTNVSRVGCR